MDFRLQLVDQLPPLRRYARSLMRCREQADDLVQDTLERALIKRNLFRNGTDLRAWTFTIMHNLYVNTTRKASVVSTQVSIDEECASQRHEMAIVVNPTMHLEIRDLERALDQLPLDQLEVVRLVGFEQRSYSEIALTLDIPIGTVMSRLSRGRARLRILMSQNKPKRMPEKNSENR